MKQRRGIKEMPGKFWLLTWITLVLVFSLISASSAFAGLNDNSSPINAVSQGQTTGENTVQGTAGGTDSGEDNSGNFVIVIHQENTDQSTSGSDAASSDQETDTETAQGASGEINTGAGTPGNGAVSPDQNTEVGSGKATPQETGTDKKPSQVKDSNEGSSGSDAVTPVQKTVSVTPQSDNSLKPQGQELKQKAEANNAGQGQECSKVSPETKTKVCNAGKSQNSKVVKSGPNDNTVSLENMPPARASQESPTGAADISSKIDKKQDPGSVSSRSDSASSDSASSDSVSSGFTGDSAGSTTDGSLNSPDTSSGSSHSNSRGKLLINSKLLSTNSNTRQTQENKQALGIVDFVPKLPGKTVQASFVNAPARPVSIGKLNSFIFGLLGTLLIIFAIRKGTR